MRLKRTYGKVLMLGTAAFMLGAVAMIAQPTNVNAATGRYQLVWSDEFTGSELNRNNWTPLTGNGGSNPGWGNNEKEYYKDSDENIQVSDGTLKIIAKEETTESDEGTFYYTSARMVSSGLQSFQYGKIEARIKLPVAEGVWPAFWMMGYNNKGWPYCGEIDILESYSSTQFVSSAWHWYNDDRPNAELWTMYKDRRFYGTSSEYNFDGTLVSPISKPWSGFDKSEWHNYGIIWDKDAIRFTVDDKIFYVIDTTSASMSEANGEYYFLLNMAVGGNLCLNGAAPTSENLPQTMEVDYVRVYQQSGTGSKCTNSTWADTDKASVAKYTVSINGKTSTVYDGETLDLPTLTKKGYIFEGYYDSTGKKVNSAVRVRKNYTIKSKWTKVKVATPKVTLTARKKALSVKAKVAGAKGIQVKYSLKKTMKSATSKSILGKSITLPRLKSGTTYYVRVRAYKLDSKKQKIWSKWSTVASKTVK